MRGPIVSILKFPAFAAATVRYSDLNGLVALVQQRNGPEHEFLDPELEELRAQFVRRAAMFLSIVQVSTETVHDKPDSFRVSTHLATIYPGQYQRMTKVLDEAAAELYTAYRLLVRSARQQLSQ